MIMMLVESLFWRKYCFFSLGFMIYLLAQCTNMDSSQVFSSVNAETGMVTPSFNRDQSTVFCIINLPSLIFCLCAMERKHKKILERKHKKILEKNLFMLSEIFWSYTTICKTSGAIWVICSNDARKLVTKGLDIGRFRLWFHRDS